MARDGFPAYDITLSQEVLVTSVVLCFLADSPMHAEVTNTPNPGSALNPCRMCTLKVKKKKFKKSATYVQRFLNLNSFGIEVRCFSSWFVQTNLDLLFFFIYLGNHPPKIVGNY